MSQELPPDKNGGEAILPLPPVGAYLCESVETYAKYWLKAAHEARDAGRNGDAVMFAEQAVNGWKNLAYDLARQAHYYLKTQRHYAEQHTHDLYKTGDKNAPPSILDRNGEVVLGLCKLCGMGEAELVEPCAPSHAPRIEGWCPTCKGSGTMKGMTQGHGPDDYEVDIECSTCGGTGAGTTPSTTRRSDCPLENCEKTGQCEFPQDCDAPSPATPRSGETPIADAAGLWLMAEGPLPADWKCPPGQEADIRRFDHELLGPCTEWKVVTAAVARRLERKLAEAMNRCDEALEAAEAAVRQRDTALSATPCSHVICFEGEGAEVLLCRGWDDCREQFFNGIFGDGHHDWDEAQVKLWDADFANDDSWSRDENGKRYRFTADVGEISKVRIYAINAADGGTKDPCAS